MFTLKYEIFLLSKYEIFSLSKYEIFSQVPPVCGQKGGGLVQEREEDREALRKCKAKNRIKTKRPRRGDGGRKRCSMRCRRYKTRRSRRKCSEKCSKSLNRKTRSRRRRRRVKKL